MNPPPPTDRPSTGRVLAQTVHLACMGVWAGCLAMAGAAAAVLFPTMKEHQPTLGTYPLYEQEHWRLAAGHVGAKLFLVLDIAQLALALPATLALGVLLFTNRFRPRLAFLTRCFAHACALLALAYSMFMLSPRMNANLRAYWEAAAAGNAELARIHQTAFSDEHPLATRTMFLTVLAVLLSLITGIWSMAREPSGVPVRSHTAGRRPRSGPTDLEPPALNAGSRP